MPAHQATRRQVLKGAALAMAATALSRPAAPLGTDLQRGDLLQLATASTVVLHDRRMPLDVATAQRLVANGARIMALTDDPVRMWRGESGDVLAARGTRLLGLTRWPDFLLVSGLAAESRRLIRHQRFDEASGAMVWLLA